ncbi:MAG: CopG family transcriptional regulator [Candidatus Thorarchaeota archaeon]
MPKHRFQIYLDPEQVAYLHKKRDETGASVAELIRRCIKASMKKGKKK